LSAARSAFGLSGQGNERPDDARARRDAHAQETGFDTLMIDTAGRLHIDDELMVELEQIKAETKPMEVLFRRRRDDRTGRGSFGGRISSSESESPALF
jgi:hypothetical protein